MSVKEDEKKLEAEGKCSEDTVWFPGFDFELNDKDFTESKKEHEDNIKVFLGFDFHRDEKFLGFDNIERVAEKCKLITPSTRNSVVHEDEKSDESEINSSSNDHSANGVCLENALHVIENIKDFKCPKCKIESDSISHLCNHLLSHKSKAESVDLECSKHLKLHLKNSYVKLNRLPHPQDFTARNKVNFTKHPKVHLKNTYVKLYRLPPHFTAKHKVTFEKHF